MTSVELSDSERKEWEHASKLIDEGQYLNAQPILDGLLKDVRTEPRLYAHRGYVLYRLEKYDEAIADFSSALSLKQDAKNTLFLRGRSFEELEKYGEAIADYDLVIAISPETADAYAQKGFCLEQLGDLEGARSSYELALNLDPKESLALAGLDELNRRSDFPST